MARVAVIRQGWFPLDPRVRREVDALLDAGHEVDLVCLRRPGQPIRERAGRLRVLRLPLPQGASGALGYLFEYAAFLVLAAAIVGVRHLRRRYDVVQANSLPDPLVFAAIVPRLTGARVMLDLHECMPEFVATKFGLPMRHPFVRAVAVIEQASIRFAHFSITCTEQMKEAFVDRGARADRIGVIHNTADESIWDTDKYPPSPSGDGRFTLICHGSVEARYGLDTVIRAVALLRDEIPELRVRIFGEGTELPALRRLASERGVEDRVWFSGEYVPMPQLLAAVAEADGGVVAMKRDAFRDRTHCNKMYDLIAMRRPVITSWTESVAAYFTDDALLFFESDDERDLARAIRELHADPERGERQVKRAAEEIEPYRWPRQRALYQGYVAELVAGAAPAP